MRETGLAKTIGEGLANTLNVSDLVPITFRHAPDHPHGQDRCPVRRHRAVLCVVGAAVMANVVGLV